MTKASDPSSTVHSAAELEISWENDPLNYVVRVFIAFLQSIYEAAPVGCFHWRPQLEETELVITEENPIRLDAIEQKPAISVVLGPVKFNGSSLDDLVTVKAQNAQEVHTDLLPGTMSLNHVSRVPQEARFLGWQSARMIWILRKMFIKEAHIHEVGRMINVASVTPAGALVQGDNEGEWHSVTVSVPFFLQWTDRVTPLKHDWNTRPIHPLEAITTCFRTRMGRAQANLTHTQNVGRQLWGTTANNAHIRPPRIRGKQIKLAVLPSESLKQTNKV